VVLPPIVVKQAKVKFVFFKPRLRRSRQRIGKARDVGIGFVTIVEGWLHLCTERGVKANQLDGLSF